MLFKLKMTSFCCRSPSKRYARRTVGGSTRDAILEERSRDGYGSLPHSQSVHDYRRVIATEREHSTPPRILPTARIPASVSHPAGLYQRSLTPQLDSSRISSRESSLTRDHIHRINPPPADTNSSSAAQLGMNGLGLRGPAAAAATQPPSAFQHGLPGRRTLPPDYKTQVARSDSRTSQSHRKARGHSGASPANGLHGEDDE